MLVPASLTAASFLAGSIPFAWIAAKALRGVDLRTVGSGNVGATNASRVLGGGWFFAVFVLDAAKGALPVLCLAPIAGLEGSPAAVLRSACGFAAILGHVFCPWLGFRGGKGVATGAGAVAALAPPAALVALPAFGLTLVTSRFMSLASCVAAAALAPAAWLMGSDREVVVFCAVLAALVLWKHRANFGRIAAGTEPRAFRAKKEAGDGG